MIPAQNKIRIAIMFFFICVSPDSEYTIPLKKKSGLTTPERLKRPLINSRRSKSRSPIKDGSDCISGKAGI